MKPRHWKLFAQDRGSRDCSQLSLGGVKICELQPTLKSYSFNAHTQCRCLILLRCTQVDEDTQWWIRIENVIPGRRVLLNILGDVCKDC